MKPILLLLIAIALVMTAQMREHGLDSPIGPTDEIIDRELAEDLHRDFPEDGG